MVITRSAILFVKMPLPPALQARLKKRGILQKDKEKEKADNEEASVNSCPNAWNPHHTCVEYCRQRWGKSNGLTEAPKVMTVPLPPGWFLVPDSTSGANYYWNTSTNQVSWLHPFDPSANITAPASVLDKHKENEVQPNRAIPPPPGTDQSQEKEQVLSIGRHPSLVKGSQKKQEAAVKRKQSERESKSEKCSKTDALDPMDPASYTDVPRGTWSTGLPQVGDAKTGVDTTANGPLFQMRPYPSPGAILRQNQQLSQK